jgi:arginyl-tRNA synthetase
VRVVHQVAESAEPHRLCAYLFEVDDEETRNSRLALCAAALRVLSTGLGPLGVPIPERM